MSSKYFYSAFNELLYFKGGSQACLQALTGYKSIASFEALGCWMHPSQCSYNAKPPVIAAFIVILKILLLP